MDSKKIKDLVKNKGVKVLSTKKSDLTFLKRSISNHDVIEYISECLPEEEILASETPLLSLESIKIVHENRPLSKELLPFGFITIAGTVGGNVICVDEKEGKVYFADHERFCETRVYYVDKDSGKWKTVEGYTFENILKGLILISDNLEQFIVSLLNDELTDYIDKLDEGTIKY